MDFSNKVYFSIPMPGGFDIWISEMTVGVWIIGAILIAFAIIVRIKLNNFKEVPESKFQNIIEALVDMFQNFVVSTMGTEYAYFGNWFFGVIIVIWCCNMSGLFGMRPPTANLAMTAGLGIATFAMIHFMGIVKQKGEYFKGYLSPVFIFLPVNIIGELATPISLSFRLFGNVLGGTILMGLIYALFPWFTKIGVPAVLHIYFDVFSGSLQAFIFCILSMTFIRNKIPD